MLSRPLIDIFIQLCTNALLMRAIYAHQCGLLLLTAFPGQSDTPYSLAQPSDLQYSGLWPPLCPICAIRWNVIGHRLCRNRQNTEIERSHRVLVGD